MAKKKINFTKLILELLVVFLGVSAGFVLQNKKENDANAHQLNQYLDGFYADVEENIEGLNAQIERDSIWLANNTYVIQAISVDSLEGDSASSVIQGMANFSLFTPHSTTYETIKNSGNLNLIQDYKLRSDLVQYYTSLEDFAIMDNYLLDYNQNVFMPFLLSRFDLFTGEMQEENLHRSLQFKNIFAGYFSLKQQRLALYQELLTASLNLKTTLEKNKHENTL